MPDGSRKPIAIVIAVFIVAGVCFLSPAYIRPDSVAVFAYLRSAVVDGDFSFFNEWTMAGLVRGGVTLFSEVTQAGALANHWWIGTSIVSAPPYLVALPFSGAADGFTGLAGVVLAWTNVAFAIACCAIALSFTRDVRHRGIALFAAVAGTPFFFYTFRFPLGTHIAGALAVGLLIAALFTRFDSDALAGFAVGLAAGLAIATRLQHFVLIPAASWAGARQRRDRVWWLAAFAGGLLALAPQAIAWNAIYGSPLGPLASGGNLTGTTWMPFQHIALGAVLFSSFHGLFSWSPVVLLAVAGWIRESRSPDASRRVLAMTLLLMFAGEWIANGTFDRFFWGGLSFGPRRFVDLFVPIAIGLAWFATAAWAAALEIALSAWTLALAAAAVAGTLPLARYVSASEVIASVANIRALPPLHSAIGDAKLALQSLAAIAIVAACAAGARLISRSARRAVIGAGIYLAIVTLWCGIAAVRTTHAAARDATRFHIDLARSRRFGPLLDERGLLADEVTWAHATGDESRAAETSREIAEIDALLRN